MQIEDTSETLEQAVDGIAEELRLFGVTRLLRSVG